MQHGIFWLLVSIFLMLVANLAAKFDNPKDREWMRAAVWAAWITFFWAIKVAWPEIDF